MALHEHPFNYLYPTSITTIILRASTILVKHIITLYHCNLYAQLLSTWYTG